MRSVAEQHLVNLEILIKLGHIGVARIELMRFRTLGREEKTDADMRRAADLEAMLALLELAYAGSRCND